MSSRLFCKFINSETRSQKVYEGESVVAFEDFRSQTPLYVLVRPRVHIPTLNILGVSPLRRTRADL
jgi:histidine triad (HIT) family protein